MTNGYRLDYQPETMTNRYRLLTTTETMTNGYRLDYHPETMTNRYRLLTTTLKQ